MCPTQNNFCRWSSTEAADSSSPRLPTRRVGWVTTNDNGNGYGIGNGNGNDASPECPAKKPASTTQRLPTPTATLSCQQSSILTPRRSSTSSTPNPALTKTAIMRPTPNKFSTQGILQSSCRWNASSSSSLPPRRVHRLLSSRWSSTEAAAEPSSPRLPTRRAGWATDNDNDTGIENENDASPECPAKKPASTTKHLPTPTATLSYQHCSAYTSPAVSVRVPYHISDHLLHRGAVA